MMNQKLKKKNKIRVQILQGFKKKRQFSNQILKK